MKQMIEINADVSKARTIDDSTAGGSLHFQTNGQLTPRLNATIGPAMNFSMTLAVADRGRVRRLAFLVCVLVLLAACGHKNVQVKTPQPGSVSSKDLEGLASYYAEPYHGRRTASGEIFDTYQGMTAAHRTLPFDTLVRVTNKQNGRQVDVRINDRGPWVDGRVIDLSLRAARQIDLVRTGVAPVKLRVLREEEFAKATTPAPSSRPLFGVQVGAFENQHTAEDLKRKLEKKYSHVTIQTFTAGKTLYRVRIGREPDIQSAEKLASQLRKEDLKGFVVRTD